MDNLLIKLCVLYLKKIDGILDDLISYFTLENTNYDLNRLGHYQHSIVKIYFHIFDILKFRNIEKDYYFENTLNFENFCESNIVFNKNSNFIIAKSILNILQLKETIKYLLEISKNISNFEIEFINFHNIFLKFNLIEYEKTFKDYRVEIYYIEYRNMIRKNSEYERENDPDFIDEFDKFIEYREIELLCKYRDGDLEDMDLTEEDRKFLNNEIGNYF